MPDEEGNTLGVGGDSGVVLTSGNKWRESPK